MKKNKCLVIVVYPGMLNNLKKLVKRYNFVNFVIFFNNFKTFPKIKNIQYSIYMDYSIFKCRVEMIKTLKKLNYENFIFHDIDDKFNYRRYLFLPKLLKENNFVINDLKINNKLNYFSKRIKNNQKICPKILKNCNFAGMTNSACTKKLIEKISFNKNDLSKLIFDWMLWAKASKISDGIFTNKVYSYYNVKKSSPTNLPTNYKNKIHIKFIKKVRKKHSLKTKEIEEIKNNFWWET